MRPALSAFRLQHQCQAHRCRFELIVAPCLPIYWPGRPPVTSLSANRRLLQTQPFRPKPGLAIATSCGDTA